MARWSSDVIGGLVVAALGGAALVPAVGYGLGSLRQMRAGYFPAVVSIALIIFGIVIAVTGLRRRSETLDVSMRPLIAILAAGFAFAALIRSFGLIPAMITCVLLSSMGDRGSSVGGALVLALAVAALAVLIFTYGLGLSLPLLRLPR